MAKHPRKRRLPGFLLFLALAVLAALFLRWDSTALQTTYFDPVFADLPEGFDGCRIAVLSDLHGAEFGENNQELFTAVAQESPDYIVYLGDLEDHYR